MSVDLGVPGAWPESEPENRPASEPASLPESEPASDASQPQVTPGPTPAAPVPPVPPVSAAPALAVAVAPATSSAWSLAHRIAFRFAFCYLLLYNLPFPLDELPIPGLGAVFTAYFKLWDAVVLWTGAHVLHLAHPIQILRGKTGSGDTTYNYVQILCFAALAALATLAWTLVALGRGKAREHRRLHEGLRIYVRYSLGAILLGYGLAKVIKTQFPFPSQDRLLEPIGEASPMGLLWTFMGVSTPYTVFAGATFFLSP